MGFQFRDLPPGSTADSVAYCTIPRFSKRSYFGRHVPLASTTRGSPLAAKGGTMGEKWWPNGSWDMHPVFFYMPQIGDMGPIILLPFRRKACWGFLSPCKNPTASAGFEASTLPLHHRSRCCCYYSFPYLHYCRNQTTALNLPSTAGPAVPLP